jgi:hypothetical protein
MVYFITKNVGKLYDHLEYFTTIWFILWPSGKHLLWLFGIYFSYFVIKNSATLNCKASNCVLIRDFFTIPHVAL